MTVNHTVKNILDHCRNYSGGDYSFSENRFVRRSADFAACDWRELLARSGIVKNSRSTTAGVIDGMFIKRYNPRGWWHSLKRRFQLPRPWRCLAAALHLEAAGIATPQVFFASRDLLVTDELPVGAHFLDRMEPLPGPEMAIFLAQLHRAGVWHGDVSLRNLYHDGTTYGVIDLDAARLFRAQVPDRDCRRELARLISSWMICARQAHWELDVPRVIEEFCRAYRNGGGAELNDTRLARRVHYLACRVRKK